MRTVITTILMLLVIAPFAAAQDQVAAFQLNVSYSFKPRMLLALGARRITFGNTTLNGVEWDDPADNSCLASPVGRGFTAKLT